ncbi:DUF3592 domain-containing protein [Corallococcus exiguus]|uniref:DUF3592 domain-containing protein n=1 Tax=Corallococcus exiguus TaxID=83462 RepID=UPI00147204D9|nr:DUF3592 domain-containing protein [Corallococcus exiguus]NNC20247.1 DUF3592 domain-containing protein [Corallococcus exiguus]
MVNDRAISFLFVESDQGALLATANATGLFCMFAPGVLILAFVAYQSMKLVRFQRGAFLLPAEVSWVAGGEDFEYHFKEGNELARLRDKEFRRRHMFQLWVLIRPEDGGEPLEIGLSTGKASKFKHGDRVQVLYNPKQPRHAVLPGENLWVGLIILGTIGLVVLGAPFLVGMPGPRW